MEQNNKKFKFRSPFNFILLLGIVSLFSDITYEGTRSINGLFLGSLGASAAVIGFVSGLGELTGYALRLLSGFLSDKTQKYWLFTIVGYFLNLLAVPLLAFAGNYKMAIILIILERVGKAIRTPSRDVMLSYAGSRLGSGWVFGLHEAMDQIGATVGPLIVVWILSLNHNFRTAYKFMFIPAFLAILTLLIARLTYPQPKDLIAKEEKGKARGFNRDFYLYIISVCFLAVGYVDFPLIAFHLQKESIAPPHLIPLFYAVAMATDALSALFLGKLFDRTGFPVLICGVSFSLFSSPLVFLFSWKFALLGMVLWGIGLGIQESILRAQISKFVDSGKRGSAFGVFNTFYGLSWFLGSAAMGIFYTHSVYYLVVFSVLSQFLSIVTLLLIKKKIG